MKAIKKVFIFALIFISSFFFFSCGQKKKNIEELSFQTSQVELFLGNIKYLQLEITPSDATGWTIVWSSTNKEIVDVNKQGKITAKGYGFAVITAAVKDSNIKARCRVQVTDGEVYKLTIDTKNLQTSYYEGEAFNPAGLIATAYYQSGIEKQIPIENLEFSCPEILTQNTLITVSYQGQTATFEVEVLPEPTPSPI